MITDKLRLWIFSVQNGLKITRNSHFFCVLLQKKPSKIELASLITNWLKYLWERKLRSRRFHNLIISNMFFILQKNHYVFVRGMDNANITIAWYSSFHRLQWRIVRTE